MYIIKRIRLAVTVFILVFFILNSNMYVFAQVDIQARSAVLMEASTGNVLYEKNADVPVPPASITKLMTLLLGFEAIDQGKAKWDDLVPVSEKAWKVEGSRMFLEVGSKVRYEDIITGISVVSANDGCVALAEYLYGSENAFVQVMNRRAQEIGLANTHFANSNGLPAEGHRMSARDIAVLARYLIQKYPQILKIESMREYTYNNISQNNRNPLLGVFPGADGLKTGWTEEAGYCLVGTAQQNGIRMISVVLNTKDESERLSVSQELLDYGFKNFEIVDVKSKGDIVDYLKVRKGKEQEVAVKLDDSISILIPSIKKDDLEIVTLKSVDSLEAPVSAGTNVGKLEVRLDGETLASADISTAGDVSKAGFFELLFRAIGEFLQSIFK
ncbi:MAG: D-alanyl-D-alanine carboxypeptidase family protein [Acetivibrionales bacterium]|jgi:D-alanyl-D-alanine carboxypeptidase (penicillin-binding protein 5/6)